MMLKPLINIFIVFCLIDVSICVNSSFPSFPSFPSLTNLAMMRRLMKFYTLQSKSERSELCEEQSKLLYNGVQTGELWAERMIDSSAKLQSGITKFHLSDVGYFDECIQIKHKPQSIKGKYCLAKIRPSIKNSPNNNLDFQDLVGFAQAVQPMMPNLIAEEFKVQARSGNSMIPISLSWAICVPDGCTAKEVQDHLNTFAGSNTFSLRDSNCKTIETYKSKLNVGDWVVLVSFGILCLIMLLSTIYDVILNYTKRETYHPILIAFSWLTNFRKLIKVSNNPDLLPSLNGIRFISMLWIIIGHEHMNIFSTLCVNLVDVNAWMKRFTSMFTLGSTVSVDSFFLLSGCLLMYGFLKMQAKRIPFNIPLFYLHRYIRLTPSYAAVIIFMLTLYRFMGSGPLWDSENSNEPCKDNWWAALLYIQNYVSNRGMCVMQSWYLQIDMQLYILAPLVLVPIGKWPKIAPFLLSILVLIFIIIPTIIAWHYRLSAFMFGGGGGRMDVYYMKTYTRAGPWVLGLLLGFYLFKTKRQKIAIHNIINILFWAISIGAMLYTLLGFYPETQPDYEYDRVFNALFIGLHRVVWSAGLSWIIFACVNGYGGPVDWFLSLPIFQVLSRLTYSLYLTHIFVQQIHARSLQMPFVFSNMHIWYTFCGTVMTNLIISIFWTLTFESPFIVLDTLLIKSITGLFSKNGSKVTTKNVENKFEGNQQNVETQLEGAEQTVENQFEAKDLNVETKFEEQMRQYD